MPKPQDQAKFWRLLTDYEALTRQETVAVWHRDYPSLEEAQRLKGIIFPVWQRLGEELGLNRSNSPELERRLEAISAAEAVNLEALDVQRQAAQARMGELSATRQRLNSVGRNYHEGTPGGNTPSATFAALG